MKMLPRALEKLKAGRAKGEMVVDVAFGRDKLGSNVVVTLIAI